ncbi:thiamine phosphate synthase [Sediminibacillus massiliensis]|uniref:thiamine phosphate synthase n=1 Tax=Sediminibacillus massiliensis TaxID=1926277 RepID=UPI00098893A4|nr:thiamine phosphate synthase [Sediminibacillus massiliensis]
MNKNMLRNYFIMGTNNCTGDPLIVLEKALRGGITAFQFREKGPGAKMGEEKKSLAADMKQLCNRYGVPFFVNDDVSLALEVKADGVHIGQEDEPITSVKKYCQEDFIIGVSATNVKEARQAVADGADYIGAGPVFATKTKTDAKTPIGLEGIKEISRLAGGTPVVAIGGINASNAKAIMDSGAAGISIISAISQADEPESAARELSSLTEF